MLKEKLEQMVAQSAGKIPAEAKAAMSAATQAVADSIANRNIPKIGDKLPAFELANSKGELQKSTDMVADGNVILTFFRGGW